MTDRSRRRLAWSLAVAAVGAWLGLALYFAVAWGSLAQDPGPPHPSPARSPPRSGPTPIPFNRQDGTSNHVPVTK